MLISLWHCFMLWSILHDTLTCHWYWAIVDSLCRQISLINNKERQQKNFKFNKFVIKTQANTKENKQKNHIIWRRTLNAQKHYMQKKHYIQNDHILNSEGQIKNIQIILYTVYMEIQPYIHKDHIIYRRKDHILNRKRILYRTTS